MITQSLKRQQQQHWIQLKVKKPDCPGVQLHHARNQKPKRQLKAEAWMEIDTMIVKHALTTYIKDKAKLGP